MAKTSPVSAGAPAYGVAFHSVFGLKTRVVSISYKGCWSRWPMNQTLNNKAWSGIREMQASTSILPHPQRREVLIRNESTFAVRFRDCLW